MLLSLGGRSRARPGVHSVETKRQPLWTMPSRGKFTATSDFPKAGDMRKQLEVANREQGVTAVKETKKTKTKCAAVTKQSSKSKSALGQPP